MRQPARRRLHRADLTQAAPRRGRQPKAQEPVAPPPVTATITVMPPASPEPAPGAVEEPADDLPFDEPKKATKLPMGEHHEKIKAAMEAEGLGFVEFAEFAVTNHWMTSETPTGWTDILPTMLTQIANAAKPLAVRIKKAKGQQP